MRQQVNLAKNIILPIKSPLDSRLMIILHTLLFIILMLIYFFILLLNNYEHQKLKNLQIRKEEARNVLIATAAKFPQTEASVKFLDPSLLPSCNIKFSRFLEQLADIQVEGVWLTAISIRNYGNEIALEGNSLQAWQAEQYLTQLKQKSAFSGLSIELSEIKQASLPSDKPTPFQPLSFHLIGKVE